MTVAVDDERLDAIDTVATQRGYQNRSEALRDVAPGSGPCVGAALYVYDHESRELAKRVMRTFHAHHELTLATLHVHLDHESCLEIAALKGDEPDVRTCAEHVIAERGVRHGRFVMFPVEERGAPMHAHLKIKEA